MASVGEQLKEAREASGLSLAEIAQSTKISIAALKALERSEVSRLPGGIYGRSFVRGYAVRVGLDPVEAVREFTAELVTAEREKARKKVRSPITPDDKEFAERQRRAMTLFRRTIAVLVLATVLFGAWQVWKWRTGDDAGTAPPTTSGSRP